MKNCGRLNVRKYKEIKGSDYYVTLDISLKFYNLDKMKITSSESKGKLERLGQGLITSLGLKAKVRPQKYKKARYAIGNVLLTDISAGISCLFVFLRPWFGLETHRGNKPLSWSFQFSVRLWNMIFILYRLSKFDEMSKVKYLSLPLISMCFLTLQQPQFFMFTDEVPWSRD